GNVTFLGEAKARIPDDVPFIGGKTIGGMSFYLQIRPGQGDAQTFAAAWTTWDIPLLVTTEHVTIGFKMDVGGHVSVLGADDVHDLGGGSGNSDVKETLYIQIGFTLPAGNIETYTFTVNWSPFADPN